MNTRAILCPNTFTVIFSAWSGQQNSVSRKQKSFTPTSSFFFAFLVNVILKILIFGMNANDRRGFSKCWIRWTAKSVCTARRLDGIFQDYPNRCWNVATVHSPVVAVFQSEVAAWRLTFPYVIHSLPQFHSGQSLRKKLELFDLWWRAFQFAGQWMTYQIGEEIMSLEFLATWVEKTCRQRAKEGVVSTKYSI